jgi:hypothetical protein
MLFSNSTPLGDEEIKQESFTLSKSDRGTKGSPEFNKNHHRATLGTSTKLITRSALTSSNITTEIEEEGVINTSDISIMFQQCGQATKQLKEIVTKYDYVKAVEIPVYADASKHASGGRWSTKTINILENPTLVTLDHVKAYSGDMFRLTPVNSSARQTQVWFLESVRNSLSEDLKTLVDDKFDPLPLDEQGGSVYLKLLFDIVYNMTEPVIQALHNGSRTFVTTDLIKY